MNDNDNSMKHAQVEFLQSITQAIKSITEAAARNPTRGKYVMFRVVPFRFCFSFISSNTYIYL